MSPRPLWMKPGPAVPHQGRWVAPPECAQVATNPPAADAKKAMERVSCLAALVARLGAGAILAEAGVFVLDPNGQLLYRALPWLANEERERTREIAAATALGWSGEETLRWFIERANGVTVEVCEPFEVEGSSVEEITGALLHLVLVRSLDAPHRQEQPSGERAQTLRAGSRGRAKQGGHRG